jgi:hypothetical protein
MTFSKTMPFARFIARHRPSRTRRLRRTLLAVVLSCTAIVGVAWQPEASSGPVELDQASLTIYTEPPTGAGGVW